MFKKVSRKKTKKKYLREGREFWRRGVEGRNLEANEKFLFILILTTRIHMESFEVSIRKRTMDKVVMTIWSQNGCQ